MLCLHVYMQHGCMHDHSCIYACMHAHMHACTHAWRTVYVFVRACAYLLKPCNVVVAACSMCTYICTWDRTRHVYVYVIAHLCFGSVHPRKHAGTQTMRACVSLSLSPSLSFCACAPFSSNLYLEASGAQPCRRLSYQSSPTCSIFRQDKWLGIQARPKQEARPWVG